MGGFMIGTRRLPNISIGAQDVDPEQDARDRAAETERRRVEAVLSGEGHFRAPGDFFLETITPEDRSRITRERLSSVGGPNVPLTNPGPEPPLGAKLGRGIPFAPDTLPTAEPAITPIAPLGPLSSGRAVAPPPSEPIRALRLPNGKILFTNQASGSEIPKGSTEISRRDAGREIRQRDLDTIARMQQEQMPPGGEFDFRAISPAQDLSSDLLRRSADVEFRRGQGEDLPEGGLSTLPATPETSDRLAIEEGERKLQLQQLASALDQARRDPADIAADRNQNLQTFNQIFPLISESNQRIAAVQDPNSPLYIEDANVRAQAIQFEQSQITAMLQAAGLSRPTSFLE